MQNLTTCPFREILKIFQQISEIIEEKKEINIQEILK